MEPTEKGEEVQAGGQENDKTLQQVSLNGAQVTSLVDVVSKVKMENCQGLALKRL